MEMEKRILPQLLSEVRAIKGDDGIFHILGTGIVFNQRSQKLGFFVEIIDQRALDEADMSDMVSCFNHDMNFILGRSSNNTMSFSIDDKGLHYDTLPQDNQTRRDMVIDPIQRRDVTGSSFIFATARRGDDWEEEASGLVVRYVRKIERVFETGPVTMPAYTQTSTDVHKRSFDDFIKETRKVESMYRSHFAKAQLSLLRK